MDLLARAGAVVPHNPVSNLRVANGLANVHGMLSRGTVVALGANGAASNDNQNMWEVVKLEIVGRSVAEPRVVRRPLVGSRRPITWRVPSTMGSTTAD
jgi:5-methylthioadenosine/S-adenosylhomocysteine deaminase